MFSAMLFKFRVLFDFECVGLIYTMTCEGQRGQRLEVH